MGNNAVRGGLLGESGFRAGVRTLGARGCSFDAMVYHTQIAELTELARACPEVTIVANHLCVPIAGGPYRGRADEVRAVWRRELPALAGCENVVLKIGALIRPLSGERWDKREVKASSEEIADRVGRRDRVRHRHVRPVALPVRVELPRRQGLLRLRRAVERASSGMAAAFSPARSATSSTTPRHGPTGCPTLATNGRVTCGSSRRS